MTDRLKSSCARSLGKRVPAALLRYENLFLIDWNYTVCILSVIYLHYPAHNWLTSYSNSKMSVTPDSILHYLKDDHDSMNFAKCKSLSCQMNFIIGIQTSPYLKALLSCQIKTPPPFLPIVTVSKTTQTPDSRSVIFKMNISYPHQNFPKFSQ